MQRTVEMTLMKYLGLQFTLVLLWLNPTIAQPYDVRNYRPAEFKAKPQVYDILQDDRGLLYFASASGVLEFDATTWRLIELPNSSGAYSLAKGIDGRIYVGGKGEFGFLAPDERGTMRYLTLKHKISSSMQPFTDIVHAAEAVDSTVVFCSDKFLLLCTPDTVTAIHTRDHFYGAASLHHALYVSESQKGLCVVRDDTLATVSGGAGLKAFVLVPNERNQLLIITTDRKIYQYAPSAEGIESYTRPGVAAASDWKADNIAALTQHRILCGWQSGAGKYLFGTVQHGLLIADSTGRIVNELDTGDGLPDNDINATLIERSGLIWLATNNGISSLGVGSGAKQATASGIDTPRKEFYALIRSVQSLVDEAIIFDGASYKQKDGIQLIEQTKALYKKFPFNYNSFRFVFSTNFYSITDTMMYQSRLEGFDKNWSSWSSRNLREYTNLGPGDYILHVRAMNYLQEASLESSYAFEIKPPWHEAWWFYLIQLLVITCILLTSAVVDRAGKHATLSENLVVFSAVIVMRYINTALTPFIGPLSQGIGFLKILTTAVTSYALKPLEKSIKAQMAQFAKKFGKK
jgi:hypothetical protein